MNFKPLQSRSNRVSGKLERIRHDAHVCMLVEVSACSRRILKRQREEKKVNRNREKIGKKE